MTLRLHLLCKTQKEIADAVEIPQQTVNDKIEEIVG